MSTTLSTPKGDTDLGGVVEFMSFCGEMGSKLSDVEEDFPNLLGLLNMVNDDPIPEETVTALVEEAGAALETEDWSAHGKWLLGQLAGLKG